MLCCCAREVVANRRWRGQWVWRCATMKGVDAARIVALAACLPTSLGFAWSSGAPSLQPRSRVAPGSVSRHWTHAVRVRRPGSKSSKGGALYSRSALFGFTTSEDAAGENKSPTQVYATSESELDAEESRVLEALSSILTTDDGLRLSGAEMREARSNWVRDIMSTGQSRVLSKISSRLAVTVCMAAAVAVVSNWSPEGSWWLEVFQVPGWPHELVGGFLAILLVFRTDQAYERFWEGRTLWSTMASEMRTLARVTVSNRQLTTQANIDEILAHLSAFPVALKQHLRGDNDTRELEAIYTAFGIHAKDCDSVRRILRCENTPLVIMSALSISYNKMVRQSTATEFLSQSMWERTEDSLGSVSKILSDCEKIKCTPLPLSYSRHSSRFFTLFSLTLPFSLVKDTTPLLIAPVVVGISWILFATDEIGHVIEEPFGSGLAQENVDLKKTFPSPLSSETFNYFDKDQSGSVDSTEFLDAMSKMGYNFSQEETDEIVKKFDQNYDGSISNEEWRQEIIDELERKAKGKTNDMMKSGANLAGGLGNVLVMGINGFYDVVGMVFGIGMEDYQDGVKQLEVLPLARYCRSIQRDVLEQILFVSTGAERERYIAITKRLAKATQGDVEIIG